jgi:tetratricopeptide (TPR) repeat protein
MPGASLKAQCAAVWACLLALALSLALGACRRAEGHSAVQRITPPFTADKVQILAKLRKRDFGGLDSEFQRYQQQFEKNPTWELNEKLAFGSFATDDTRVADLVATWLKQRPDSFAAHRAMANYYSWRGWHTRGPAVASMTPPERFEEMRRFFAESRDESRAALKIKPNLSIAFAVLIGEARGEGDRELVRDLQAESLQQVPASFVVREEVMEALYPRWGGSRELMAEFARQSQSLSDRNPCMRWLLGFVDSDEGETLCLHGEYDRSIAALSEAIRKGGDYSGFYFIRGIGYGYKTAYAEALEDLNRADELFPQDPELLIRRAYVLAELNRPSEALRDLDFVKGFEKPDDLWTQLHDWAVKGSRKAQN